MRAILREPGRREAEMEGLEWVLDAAVWVVSVMGLVALVAAAVLVLVLVVEWVSERE
jgi:hypothetical protein